MCDPIKAPKVGQKFRHSILGVCTILKVYVFGTMDVESDGGKCFRLTGLGWIKP